MPSLPDSPRSRLLALAAERARRAAARSLLAFTLATHGKYHANWHHELIASKLDRVLSSEIPRLIICVPPGHGKTELASIRLPALALGRNPDERIIACSWGQGLATKISRQVKQVLLGEEYRAIFPGTSLNPKHVAADERFSARNTADEWEIVGHRGSYLARGVGGGIAGQRFDLGIVDDPFRNMDDAYSQASRDRVWDWFNADFRTRTVPGSRIVLIMTRWHEDDLVSRLLHEAATHRGAEQWEIVELRCVREGDDLPGDPRAPGEVLWPEFFSLDRAEALRESDPPTFASLYQQRPAPDSGYDCQLDWLQREWASLPSVLGEWRISWDLRNGGKGKQTSEAVGLVFFRPHGARGEIYLVDRVGGRWEYPEEEQRFVDLCRRYPQAVEKRVENKADGRVLIPRLRSLIPGIVAWEPGTADKRARFRRILPLLRAGNLILPSERIAPWVKAYRHALATFPAGATDDDVDATSQGLEGWELGQGARTVVGYEPVGTSSGSLAGVW